MRYVKWFFIIVFWVFVAAFFHYTLPQKDIVRIVDTFEQRIDPGENRWFWAQADVGTDGTLANRDVLFIQAVRTNGRVIVYRNEDLAALFQVRHQEPADRGGGSQVDKGQSAVCDR